MDINKLLDGVDCKCGKKHLCDIEYIYVEKGAIARLEELCRDKEKIITRINQVSDITLYVPSSERCIDYLHDGLLQFCSYYYFDNSLL